MAKQATVKLSSEFLEEARREAGVVHRSVGAQIEYWARLGRALESAPGFGMDKVRQALHGGLRLDDLRAAEQDAVFDYLSAELDVPSPRVRAMFVRADWTRRGLGRRILEASEEAARRMGFTRMDLVATLPGIPLYRAFGYVPTAEIDDVGGS